MSKKKKPEPELLPALGRPSKYRTEFADQARKLCLLGYTDAELADFFEVCEATINNWKQEFPAFLESIRAGKVVADSEVAESLFRRATGEHVIIEKVVKNADGNYASMKISQYIEPDTNAARLWLLNRRPESWRDKQVIQGDPDAPIIHVVERRIVKADN